MISILTNQELLPVYHRPLILVPTPRPFPVSRVSSLPARITVSDSRNGCTYERLGGQTITPSAGPEHTADAPYAFGDEPSQTVVVKNGSGVSWAGVNPAKACAPILPRRTSSAGSPCFHASPWQLWLRLAGYLLKAITRRNV